MSATQRVVLVTGAAQGIGFATARFLFERQVRVIALDSDAEALAEVRSRLEALGQVDWVHADVSDESAVREAIENAVKRHGRLDGLVNNAGIAAPRVPIEQLERATFERVLTVNLTAVFLTCKHAVPHLRTTRGAIVNVASTRALMSEPNTEAYAASKGGIVALTHALALSLGPAIRVNCVSPGWIDVRPLRKASRASTVPLSGHDHAQHPAGRVGTPEDVARLIDFLLSEHAGFITGQNYVIDGGMTRKMIYEE
jgi:hypothetical protein